MSKKVSWHDQILPPLNHSNSEIRVLQIKPGFPDSPIRCTFHVTSLDNLDVSYEALSYAWGTGNQNTTHEDIYFGDDDDDTNKVGVTPPLANALRRLRLLNEPRHVWADALCINQTDNHEKSLQVSIMGRIYSTCTQGAIWVGPLGEVPEEDAQAALDTISWIAGEQEAHSWMEVSDSEEDSDEESDEDEDEDEGEDEGEDEDGDEDGDEENEGVAENGDGESEDEDEDEDDDEDDEESEDEDHKASRLRRETAAAAFKTLFLLPWWSRIWTVQEAILPPSQPSTGAPARSPGPPSTKPPTASSTTRPQTSPTSSGTTAPSSASPSPYAASAPPARRSSSCCSGAGDTGKPRIRGTRCTACWAFGMTSLCPQ